MCKLNRFTTAAVTSMLGLFAAIGGAHASRYAQVRTDVLSAEQQRPLLVTVDLEFPRTHVKTVGDAVRYALERSGYRVATNASTEQEALFELPLPDVHRSFRSLQLSMVLEALGEPGYRLVVDDANRLIAYERSPEYGSYKVAPGAAP